MSRHHFLRRRLHQVFLLRCSSVLGSAPFSKACPSDGHHVTPQCKTNPWRGPSGLVHELDEQHKEDPGDEASLWYGGIADSGSGCCGCGTVKMMVMSRFQPTGIDNPCARPRCLNLPTSTSSVQYHPFSLPSAPVSVLCPVRFHNGKRNTVYQQARSVCPDIQS